MNQMNMDDDLLAKYLANEATDAEKNEVTKWMAASDANKKQLQSLQLLWEQSSHLAVKSTINEEDAWANFKQRINADPAPKTTRTTPLPISNKWLKIAAVFVILLGGALTAWLMTDHNSSGAIATAAPPPATLHSIVVTDTAVTAPKPQAVASHAVAIKEIKKPPKAKTHAAINIAHHPFHPIAKQQKDVTIARAFSDDCLDNMKYHGPKYDANF